MWAIGSLYGGSLIHRCAGLSHLLNILFMCCSRHFHRKWMQRLSLWAFDNLYAPQTAATALTFVVLMAMHPDKQRKAQAEIDGVTEGLRLPTMADREHMPYVEAIMKEVARWHSVVPLGKILF